MKKRIMVLFGFLLAASFHISPANAAVLFSDNFDNGIKPEWGNEVGTWYTDNGVYNSTYPSNSPLTYTSITSLPNLTDFVVDFDVNNVIDGGVFLRAQDNQHGILLATGGVFSGYTGLHWHVLNGGYTSTPLGLVYNVPNIPGGNVHITVEVIGNTYKAYVNGELRTTLLDDTYTSGRVALYDFSAQTFDNFQISTPTPEPSSMILGLMGLGSMLGLRRRK
jgi:hypothetical protein